MAPAHTPRAKDDGHGQRIVMHPDTTAHLQELAQEYEQSHQFSWWHPSTWFSRKAFRHDHFGGDDHGRQAVAQYGATIDRVVKSLEYEHIHTDPTLLRAVLCMEQTYNPDIHVPVIGQWVDNWFEKTTSPMNVNYHVWQDLLNQHNIHSERDLQDPETNIRAAALILAKFDKELVHRQHETLALRVARIASLYGDTNTTAKSGEILPFGAKVATIYARLYAESQHPHTPEGPAVVTPDVPRVASSRQTARSGAHP